MAGQGGLHTFDAREGVGLVLASPTLGNIRVGRGAGVPTDTSRAPAVLETGARGGSSETIFFMHYLDPLQKFGRGRRDMYDDDLRAGKLPNY